MTVDRKNLRTLAAIIGGIVAVAALLFYLQNQGLIKIFPTAEERANKKILTIDRSKFAPAEGLSEERFEEEIQKLYELKKTILENPQAAQAWFLFGFSKGFLNDHQGAVAAWEKSFELQPLNFLTALNLGNTYQYFVKDLAKAEFYYFKALELRPDYTLAYEGLADLYRYNLKAKQNLLEPLLLDAIEKDSVNQGAYLNKLVDFFAEQDRDLKKAREYLQELEKIDSASAKELLETYPKLR